MPHKNNQFIQPLIRELQERCNKLYKEYDVRDCVICAYNNFIGFLNRLSLNVPALGLFEIKARLNFTDFKLIESIYFKYNSSL